VKLLYVTAVWAGLDEPNMHVAFVKEAAARGHDVTVMALCEKRTGKETSFEVKDHIRVLSVRCGNIQKTNKYEKVISSVLANFHMLRSMRRFLRGERYDLVVWSVSTTLICFAVQQICKSCHAREYLLLKEYWPQDPVDLGALKEGGLVYKVLRYVEKTMLDKADRIGVSSPAGIRYVEERYPWNAAKCEVCPHCEMPLEVQPAWKSTIREKYGISPDKTVFLYGGNFGISQGVDDMIACVRGIEDISDAQVVLLGSGTEFQRVRGALIDCRNVLCMDAMGYREFFQFATACDCGLIFLYRNYHVPNVPGKLNTYLNAEIPIIACVDDYTDAGRIVEDGGAGFSVRSGDVQAFRQAVLDMLDGQHRTEMACAAKQLLLTCFTPEISVKTVEEYERTWRA